MSTGAAELLQDTGGTVGGPEKTTETPQEIAARSPLQLFWRRLRKDKVALVALGFIVLLILVALFANQVISLTGQRPPNDQSTEYLDEFGSAGAPSSDNWFGTDALGRSVFSRVIIGARISLEVAFISTAIILVIGVVLGMVAGYYRGAVDTLISRCLDVLLAFPVLLLALGLGAACSLQGCLQATGVGRASIIAGLVLLAVPVIIYFIGRVRGRGGSTAVTRGDFLLRLAPGIFMILLGLFLLVILGEDRTLIQPGLPVVIFVIALAGVPYMARIIRGQVLSIREKEFIEAARSLGASDSRIIFRHILPNLVAPIIVYTTLIIPTNILFEAALSFLGVGVQSPTASWGSMIADAIEIFDTAWWYMTFPGLALLLTVLAFNLVGDGLQDALNPRTGR